MMSAFLPIKIDRLYGKRILGPTYKWINQANGDSSPLDRYENVQDNASSPMKSLNG
jgi:hypothetical protein